MSKSQEKKKGEKKKWIVIGVVAVIVIASAIGGNNDKPKEEVKKVTTSTSKSTSQPENQAAATNSDSISDAEKEATASIEEQVLVDQDGIKITAKDITYDSSFMGSSLNLTIENSSDKVMTVQARDVSVNGYMLNPIMSTDIAPGKTANDDILFLSSELEENGIETIANIELKFTAFVSDNFENTFTTDTIRIETSSSGSEGTGHPADAQLAYENSGISIYYKEISDADWLGTGVKVFVENNSDQAVTIQTRDMSVNGYMIDGIFSCDVMPGKAANDSITLLQSYLDENGIESIDNVEVKFVIMNKDTFSEIATSDPITLS